MRRVGSAVLILVGAATFVMALGGGAQGQIPSLPLPTSTTLAIPLIGEVTVPTLPVTTTIPSTGGVTVPTTPALPPVTTVSSIVGSTVSTATSVVGSVTGTVSTAPATVLPKAIDCASFATQLAAQAAMKADPSLAAILDGDRDGAACELLLATPGGSAPSTPSGHQGAVVASSSGSAAAAVVPSGGDDPGGQSSSAAGDRSTASGSPRAGEGLRRGEGARGDGTRTVELTREHLVGTNASNAAAMPGGAGEGVRHAAWKVTAFVLLMAVTTAAAARKEDLLAAP